MVGDGSYLMLSAEIVTSIQEGVKLVIVLLDNSGYKSIGALSRSLGQEGFGTRTVFPSEGMLPGDEAGAMAMPVPVDLAMNARSLGAHVIECETYDDFAAALATAKTTDRTTVISIQNDRYESVPGYEGWWDVPVAAVSESAGVRAARAEWETMRAKERTVLVSTRGAFRIGNAPCSWGVLEFDGLAPEAAGYARMLDELVATGYTGTELGDWGFMPTDPARLREELARRGVTMIGAFVPVALRDPGAHAEGAARAVRTAQLLAAVAEPGNEAGAIAPVVVLADDNGTDATRTRFAGRITPAMGLPADEWPRFCGGCDAGGAGST